MYPEPSPIPTPDPYDNYSVSGRIGEDVHVEPIPFSQSRRTAEAPSPTPTSYPTPISAAQPDPRDSYAQQQPTLQQPPVTGGPQLPPQQQQVQQSQPRRKACLDDFLFLTILAKGTFGKIMLAEEKRTKGLYAIKVLKKAFTIENNEVERSVED